MQRRNFLKYAAALGGLSACNLHRALALDSTLVAGPTSAAKPLTAPIPGKFVDITKASGVNFIGQASHTSKK